MLPFIDNNSRHSKLYVKDYYAVKNELLTGSDDGLGRVRELEEKRINKEMANIRSKFKGKQKTFVVYSL